MTTLTTKINPAAKADDAAVIQSVLSGNIADYEAIVRKYNGYLYKVGRSYGFSHEDVEDLMQETFVNAYINLNKFRGEASFKTWLVRIMLHQCYHKNKKSSFKNEKVAQEDLETENPAFFNDRLSDGNREVQSKELGRILEQAILQMKEEYRSVFSLRELTGLSIAETADLLKISESNVKVRLNRAKKMLQDSIQAHYSAAEIFEFNLIYCDGIVHRVLEEIRSKNLSTEKRSFRFFNLIPNLIKRIKA